MLNVDFYKTFLPRILFHEEKSYPTLVLSVCRYVSQCVFFNMRNVFIGPSLCLCMLVRDCVFVCIFLCLCLCLCLCFHSSMPVFVFVPVFISIYNLSTIWKRALFNLLIIVVRCITSIQWSNARQNVKDQNNSALLFNNIQLFFFYFKFIIHSNSIPILELYTDTFKTLNE